jgi:hypothetical protein
MILGEGTLSAAKPGHLPPIATETACWHWLRQLVRLGGRAGAHPHSSGPAFFPHPLATEMLAQLLPQLTAYPFYHRTAVALPELDKVNDYGAVSEQHCVATVSSDNALSSVLWRQGVPVAGKSFTNHNAVDNSESLQNLGVGRRETHIHLPGRRGEAERDCALCDRVTETASSKAHYKRAKRCRREERALVPEVHCPTGQVGASNWCEDKVAESCPFHGSEFGRGVDKGQVGNGRAWWAV